MQGWNRGLGWRGAELSLKPGRQSDVGTDRAWFGLFELGQPSFVWRGRAAQHSLGPFGHVLAASFLVHIAAGGLRVQAWNRPFPFEKFEAEARIKRGDLPFLRTITNADGFSEKEPRLKDDFSQAIQPSDQPVTYASAMLPRPPATEP